MKFLLLLLLTSFTFSYACAQEKEEFTVKENIVNFSAVYAAQLTYYYIDQRPIIEKYGSWDNWRTNPFRPHFDRDSFDYNIFRHSITGNYYYLWYRSRGHTTKHAFIWSFVSSLAFEFTIETFTEKPSFQDIYQTPVFGTVLGIGIEQLSLYCHSWDNGVGHTLGYILNPFTLIPRYKDMSVTPVVDDKKVGVIFSSRF